MTNSKNKKEEYFTGDSIDKVSRQFLKEVKLFRDIHPFKIKPNNVALLIIDMQKIFTEEKSKSFIPSSLAILPKIKKIADEFSKRNLPIILTKQINNKSNAKLMDKWWSNFIESSGEKGKIVDYLKNIPSVYTVEKSQYDAFYKTNLEKILKKKKIKQIVICGVSTNICCEATAFSAFARGLEIFFLIDATATINEEFHQSSLLNLASSCVYPVLSQEIISVLGK